MFARRVGLWALGAGLFVIVLLSLPADVAAQGFCIPPTACPPEVTPDGSSVSDKYVSSGPFSQTFSVFNPYQDTMTVSLECNFTAGSCSVTGSSEIDVPGGQSVNKNVSYSTGSSGAASATLTLTGTIGSESDDGTVTMEVIEPELEFTTPDSTSIVVNGSGQAIWFVQNIGSQTESFDFACDDDGAISCDGQPSPSSADLDEQAIPTQVTVSYDAAATPGAGSIILRAQHVETGIIFADTAIITVEHSYGVAVSRLAGTSVMAGANSNDEVYPFQVNNLSTDEVTFDLECEVGGNVVDCDLDEDEIDDIELAAGDSATVLATFDVGNTGSGTVSLIASSSVDGGIADTASVTAIIVDVDPLVVAALEPTVKRQQQTGPYDADFTILNNGPTRDFFVTCVDSGQVTCDTDTTMTIELDSAVTVPITVEYDAENFGSGTITLRVEAGLDGPYAIDSASVAVSVGNFAVTVTPNDSTVAPKAEGSEFTVDFLVANSGTIGTVYDLLCDPDGQLRCVDLPASIAVDSGETDTVTVTYATEYRALTGNILRLIATSVHYDQAVDTGSINVPVAAFGVALSPQEKTTGVSTGHDTLKLAITNLGTQTKGFGITVDCTGIADSCPSASSIGLDSLETDTLEIDFEISGSVGDSGLIEVAAVQLDDSSVVDTARITVVIGTGKTPIISTEDAGDGPDNARGLCLTIAAGPGAAVNCGDLRLVYGLSARTTMNRVRAGQLVYNSRTADPHALVPVNAFLPEGGITPDSVIGRLAVEVDVGVTDTTETKWDGAPWSPGRAARVVIPYYPDSLATGVYDYTVEIVAYVGGTAYDTTDTGALTIVNRRDDNRLLGVVGWWLAGIEDVHLMSDNRLLWVGGDGSARVYDSIATGLWMADTLMRPDSIQRVGSRYVRRIPGGSRVEFDLTGRHVTTINRLDDSTVFHYQDDRLSQLDAHTPLGLADVYLFEYDDGELDAVIPLIWSEQVEVRRSNGRITRLVHDHVDSVTFDYDGAGTLITSRTDPMATTTSYSYDSGHAITRISTDVGDGDSIVTQFRPFETRGLTVATDTADAYALLDGPRSEVGDSARFWVDRYGAPERIVDALGNQTTIERTDSRFPALATKLTDPTGHVSEAFYSDRGNLDSTFVAREAGTAVTKYEWDTRWDFVKKVISPEDESVEMAYDTTNGNRLWQKDTRGDSTRTFFEYDSGDPALLLRVIGPVGDTTTIGYDFDGNVDSVTSPLGFVTESFKDEVGRDTLIVSPIASGKTTIQRIVYDARGRVDTTMTIGPSMSYDTLTVPAETLTVVNTYDAAGRVTEVRRRSDPDINSVGWNISLFTYDAVGRTVAEQHHVVKDSTIYDKASNAIRVITGRGHEVEMSYDPLNRLFRRVVQSVTHEAGEVTSEINTDFHRCAGSGTFCPWEFPVYPNNGSSFVIATDTSLFQYDMASRTTRAENRSATVTRTYTTSGLLSTETLTFKDGSALTYSLNYAYDLNGRRDTLIHPGNLTLGSGIQTYDYTTFGAMESTTSVLGHQYSYAYDAAARVITFTLPIGSEAYQYDIDGRRTKRTVTVDGTVLNRDSLAYDQRGRILTVTPVGSPDESWPATMAYSGLGALAFSQFESPNAPLLREEFRTDALGNRSWSSTYSSISVCNEPKTTELTYNTGRLFELAGTEPYPTCLPPTFDMFQDTTVQYHDASGNVERTGREEWLVIEEDQWVYREASWNYYAADQRLVARQVYRDSVEVLTPTFQPVRDRWGVWEQYEYDALGRRIRKEVSRGPEICNRPSACISAIERYIWDGDQLLYETRSGGGGETQNGTVGYTHGLGLDAPLDLMRQGYSYTDDRAVIPHTNWRGDFASGTFADSAEAFDCVILGCNVAWPAGNQSAFMYDGKGYLSDWMGSLWESKRDESGLMYMRNRYYDPATGQFTQQDPIGLAGGINLYGFSDADPVNFQDPYGLCIDDDEVCHLLVELFSSFEGELFDEAAQVLEDNKWYRFEVVAADHPGLGAADLGHTTTRNIFTGKGSVYINGELSGIDQIVVAAHETLYHVKGHGAIHPANPGPHRGDYDIDVGLVREAAGHPNLPMLPDAFIRRLEERRASGASQLRALFNR